MSENKKNKEIRQNKNKSVRNCPRGMINKIIEITFLHLKKNMINYGF